MRPDIGKMKTEADPITDDEWLLRRVHKTRFRTAKVPIISPTTFEPRVKGNEPDWDGISLYRRACLDIPNEISTTVAPEKLLDIGIVRVRVKELLDLGLTVEPRPDPQVRGHVVIPELNAKDYAVDRSRFTPSMLALATLASDDANIVIRPADLH